MAINLYGVWSEYVRGQYPEGGKVPSLPARNTQANVPNPNAGLSRAGAVPLPATRRAGTTATGTFSKRQPDWRR